MQSMLKMSHKKPSTDGEPKTPKGANSAEDSQAASLKASTVPQGSFVSLSSFKPSNPFAKKPKPDEHKPESMLESIKKMQKVSEPEGKRKQMLHLSPPNSDLQKWVRLVDDDRDFNRGRDLDQHIDSTEYILSILTEF